MLALEAGLAVALILVMRREDLPLDLSGNGAGNGTVPGARFASIAKSRLLARTLGARVSGWRRDLAWATAAGVPASASPCASSCPKRCSW